MLPPPPGTLDLNVFGFMESYEEGYSPNYIDDDSRYAFGRQPSAAVWNLARVADALTGTPFVADSEPDRDTWYRFRRKLRAGPEAPGHR